MRGSLGASSSKSKSSSGSGSTPVAARAPPAKKKGGKRGAPQTFASKLFNVLQAAEGKKGSPISWCLEGNSFTVHNDKEFETQVLTANYRHGKFSSFQRQLNMYGFRKVADCSDRTYSHPFFRRDQSDLLAQVRRVVNDTVGAANANATFSPSGNPVVKRPAHALAPSIRRPKQQQAGGRKGESADNGESGGGGGSRRPPARKKARRCRDVTPSSSAVSTATTSASGVGGLRRKLASGGVEAVGSASPRGDGDSTSTVFPAPSPPQQLQQQQPGRAAAAAIASTTPAAQQTRLAPRPWPQQQHQQQRQRVNEEQLHHQQRPLSAQEIAAGQRNPSLQEFSSVWSRHTGRWDAPALSGSSLGDDGGTWTTASSSAASSVEEAVSPVLLPTTPASLDCSKSFVPPFRLQQDVSPSLADMCRRNGYGGHPASSSGAPTNTFGPSNPALVSPAPVMFGGGGGGGGRDAEVDVLDGRRGDPTPPSTVATFARSSPAMTYHSEAQGPVGQDAPGEGLYIMGGGTGWRGGGGGGGGGRGDEGGILPADKAGHGPTPTRCPSFDKIFGRQEPHSSSHDQPGMAQLDNPRTAKPGAAVDTGNAVVPVSPTASANAAADGWDLACLGGAGWGSPDTTESPAAEVWAAIPPLVAQESCERGVSPRPSPFGEAGGMGGVYHQQQQQQQQQQDAGPYNRTLSPPPAFSFTVAGGGAGRKGEASGGGGAVATDPLNWSVLSNDAAKAGTRLGYADEGSMMATGGGGGVGGVVRRASPPYWTMPPPGVAPLG